MAVEAEKLITDHGVAKQTFDRARLGSILQREAVAAVVVLSGANIYYATSWAGWYASKLVAPGVSAAVVTTDHADERPVLVVTETEIPGVDHARFDVRPYPTFMFLEDPNGVSPVTLSQEKPHGFGLATSAPIIVDALRSRGAAESAVGSRWSGRPSTRRRRSCWPPSLAAGRR